MWSYGPSREVGIEFIDLVQIKHGSMTYVLYSKATWENKLHFSLSEIEFLFSTHVLLVPRTFMAESQSELHLLLQQ